MLRKRIYKLPKLPLVLLKFFLRPLSVVNVSGQDIPTDNAALGIVLRTNSRLEPVVHAVGSKATVLEIRCLTRFKRPLPGVHGARKVVRMKSVVCRPVLQFSGSLTEVFEDLAVE